MFYRLRLSVNLVQIQLKCDGAISNQNENAVELWNRRVNVMPESQMRVPLVGAKWWRDNRVVVDFEHATMYMKDSPDRACH